MRKHIELPDCHACGHPAGTHEHYHSGSYCGHGDCNSESAKQCQGYRRPRWYHVIFDTVLGWRG